ncbi:MAG: hypothetical protein KAV87_63455 [Desulfobacteraceae bacterium]|nr:hypothetical protein [Desulfobacteraceae bacterium]
MKEDKIAQDMSLHGLDEGHTGAFQAFKEIGAAETHQSFSGTGKVLELALFRRCGWVFRVWGNIVAQSITGKCQIIDCIHYLV